MALNYRRTNMIYLILPLTPKYIILLQVRRSTGTDNDETDIVIHDTLTVW